MDRFLAYQPQDIHGEHAANIMGAQGRAAVAAVRKALETGSDLEIPSPDAPGLHVWEGEFGVAGDWRRATADDLEAFGIPLSEPTGEDDEGQTPRTEPVPGFCCSMRRKFVPGIVATAVDVPVPVDLADFVIEWGTPIVFALQYCPFCGSKMDGTQTLRVLKR